LRTGEVHPSQILLRREKPLGAVIEAIVGKSISSGPERCRLANFSHRLKMLRHREGLAGLEASLIAVPPTRLIWHPNSHRSRCSDGDGGLQSMSRVSIPSVSLSHSIHARGSGQSCFIDCSWLPLLPPFVRLSSELRPSPMGARMVVFVGLDMPVVLGNSREHHAVLKSVGLVRGGASSHMVR